MNQSWSNKIKPFPLTDDKTVRTSGYLVNNGKIRDAIEELTAADIEYHKRGLELIWAKARPKR